MNKVILGGMLTSNIREIPTTTGTKMCTFSLAVRRKGNKDTMDKDTDFFNCVCFKGTANYLLTYCGKGDYVEVVGSVQNSKYTDKDKNEKIATQIIVDELDRIRVAKGNEKEHSDNSSSSGSSVTANYSMPVIEDDDDLPF